MSKLQMCVLWKIGYIQVPMFELRSGATETMKYKTDTIIALRNETEEVFILLKNAEKLLRTSNKKNLQTAADFLHQSYLLVEKHKTIKLDTIRENQRLIA